MITLKAVDGLEPNEDGYGTQQHLVRIFEKCLQLQQRKAQTYGDAFRSQGYMGNVARVLSKVSRLKNMVWTEFPIDSSEESVTDSLEDLINIAAFALINYSEGNKWGDR